MKGGARKEGTMKYQIKCGKDWEKAKIAKEVNQGFLHYELKDGTIGLARPGTWRKVA